MRDNKRRDRALAVIQENIIKRGHHVYVVSGGAIPRFAYTIGVSAFINAELILAGAIAFDAEEITRILNTISDCLKTTREQQIFDIAGFGSFTLQNAHPSWGSTLALGALDYYKAKEIRALQVLPDKDHWTIDVPDMRSPWNTTLHPAWRWLHEEWSLPVPEASTAATNLAALRGDVITEATRWEVDEWEL